MRTRQNILILDDDKFFSHLARRLAAASGQVLEECNDPTALNPLSLATYDLILLDIMMPGMDGVQIINSIGRYAPTTGVVLMTSIDQAVIDSITDLAAELGVRIHGVLHKPYKAIDLLALIESNGRLLQTKGVGRSSSRNYAKPERQPILLLQPQVSLSTGNWLGCEAVINRGVRGQVQASGRIAAELELKILDQALRAMNELVTYTGSLLSLSVTIPAAAMLQQDFDELLIELMRKHEFPGSHLVINLSGADYLEESELLQESINRLRKEHVRFSIKYSSADKAAIEYSKYPGYDEFKLDRSVVVNIRNDQNDQDLIKLLLERGARECIATVAEGIADQQTFKWLCAQGCDIGQGPLICGPEDVAGLIKWQQARQAGLSQPLGVANGGGAYPGLNKL